MQDLGIDTSKALPPRRWSGWNRGAATATVLVVAHLPLFTDHVGHLIQQHFALSALLAAALSAMLIWYRWPRYFVEPEPAAIYLALLAGVGSLAVATVLYSAWISAISLVLAAGILLLALAGTRAFAAHLLPAWALLWFTIPPPLAFEQRILQTFREVTARLSSMLLDALQVAHLQIGELIELPGRRFFVAEVSFDRSLSALVVVTAAYAVWARRRALPGWLLIASSVFWALMANVAVIVARALPDGALPDWLVASSLALHLSAFTAAFVLIVSTDHLIMLVLNPIPIFVPPPEDEEMIDEIEEPRARRLTRLWNYALAPQPLIRGPLRRDAPHDSSRPAWSVFESSAFLTISVICLVLANIQWNWDPQRRRPQGVSPTAADALPPFLRSANAEWLPPQVGPWSRVGFSIRRGPGEHRPSDACAVWHYASQYGRAEVALDHPGSTGEEYIKFCRARNWRVLQHTIAQSSASSSFHEIEIAGSDGRSTYVCLAPLRGEVSGREPVAVHRFSVREALGNRIRNGPLGTWLADVSQLLPGPPRLPLRLTTEIRPEVVVIPDDVRALLDRAQTAIRQRLSAEREESQ